MSGVEPWDTDGAAARLDLLAGMLGYSGDAGFIAWGEFDRQPNHRHALRLAATRMDVRAAFGLWTGRAGALSGPDHSRFTPLVFLAVAKNESHAREIHRRVWSQGLAPHLIIATAQEAWICEGFAFSSSHWRRHAVKITESLTGELSARLKALSAKTLRSSLAWRDEARSGDDFVDTRLLQSLADLSQAFARESTFGPCLQPAAANGLIARLLYFYFLVDRGFITSEKLSAWGLSDIAIDGGQDADWPLDATRRLFSRLDDVFNGSIFPIRPEHEAILSESHVNNIRRVLRHGAAPVRGAGLQLSFLDYDFASIRTETLSAIYEMFLHNEEAEAGRKLGAFYTPPFLADYVLDRLEDERPLVRGVRVLDPAAGSGVFLVGAYRRIVEATLAEGASQLPLKDLHEIMTSGIFGVELNETACHVAAFSLYLTMLDYADPAEAADYTNWPILKGRPRLFPPMLTAQAGQKSNIRQGDFFSAAAANLVCDVVVGNPPWVQVPKLNAPAALEYERTHQHDSPIGDRQSAELFTWKALREHLVDDGSLAFLIPFKSLVNEFSSDFARGLREECAIVGVSDLAHLRYILFRRSAAKPATEANEKAARSARQATAAVILRKQKPAGNHRFWIFRPLRPTQPATRKGRLWILLHDWTQVQWHLQTELDDAAWGHAFVGSTFDRKILRHLQRQGDRGRLTRLGDLQGTCGLQFRIEIDQKIDRKYVLGTDVRKPNYWLTQLGLEGAGLPLEDVASVVPLPETEIEKASAAIRPFLQGNVVVMSRNCELAVFVEQPAAYSFLIVAAFSKYGGEALPESHRRFMQALAAYMSTDLFRYLCFISSPRMMIDRASIELSWVRRQPWPFGKPGDPKIDAFLKATPAERENIALTELGLPEDFSGAVIEFADFREGYRDGKSPSEGLRSPNNDELSTYKATLLAEVDRKKGRYIADLVSVTDADLMALVLTYQDETSTPPQAGYAVAKALEEYNAEGASGLAQTRYLWHSREDMQTVLIKPVERLHWTRDRAFSDADLIAAAIMSRFSGRAAA